MISIFYVNFLLILSLRSFNDECLCKFDPLEERRSYVVETYFIETFDDKFFTNVPTKYRVGQIFCYLTVWHYK